MARLLYCLWAFIFHVTSTVCIARSVLRAEPALAWCHPIRGHIIKKKWLSLSEQLQNGNRFSATDVILSPFSSAFFRNFFSLLTLYESCCCQNCCEFMCSNAMLWTFAVLILSCYLPPLFFTIFLPLSAKIQCLLECRGLWFVGPFKDLSTP